MNGKIVDVRVDDRFNPPRLLLIFKMPNGFKVQQPFWFTESRELQNLVEGALQRRLSRSEMMDFDLESLVGHEVTLSQSAPGAPLRVEPFAGDSEPPTHDISLYHTYENDGIWLACDCGWEYNLGQDPSLEKALEVAVGHRKEFEK